MDTVGISPKERHSRCLALEEDYVRKVYEKIGNDLAQANDPLEEIVAGFLDNLEPGSLIADIGCGNGKHLRDKNGILSIGVDSSSLQISLSRQRCQEALLGDNLRLPLRGNAFDAALSIGVIHHFTTRERRIQALMELARILKIGGRVLIAVHKHNTQTSKDVLIPWFDVPKDKNMKGKPSFEEDIDECEIEDYGNCENDEDSISLPSSDEEDSPLINYAKIFPPKTNFAKQDWNLKRQSRSLDKDYENSSNSEPNQKQLVQTNACYTFVRNALKRFSSVSSAESDTLIEPESDRRVDLAVPRSPATSQEQRIPHCSFFNLNESMARTIFDNYIELLNFDYGQDKSSSISKINSLYGKMREESSKANPSISKKKNLIHSLSGIFKNMNGLWSTKETKSCSNLNMHGVNKGRNEQKDDRNRLVKSKTIATCKSDFCFESQLDEIEENDMTICEANKIINDFLESSLPGVENIRPSENFSVGEKLTYSDIMNGNTLNPNGGTSLNTKYNLSKCGIKKCSGSQIIKEREKCTLNEKCDKSLKNEKKLWGEKMFDTILETHEPYSEILFLSETISETQNIQFSNKYNNDVSHMDDQCELNLKNHSNIRSELEAELREKYSFLFDDIDNYELSKIKSEDPLFNKNTKTNFKNSVRDVIDEKEYEFLILDDKYNSELKNKNAKIHKKTQKDSFLENENLFSSKTSSSVEISEDSNRLLSKQTESFAYAKLSTLNKPDMEYKENENIKFKNCNFDSISMNHRSPKKLRMSNSNQTAQMFELKKLGPFYEEDDKCYNSYKNPSLCSYYSMPELHALSEFYHEYCVYQTDSFFNRNVEPSKIQDNFHEESLDVYSILPENYINMHNSFQNLPQINSIAKSPKQCELHKVIESVKDDLSVDKDIFDSCSLLQHPFKKSLFSLSQLQLDNVDLSKEINPENKSEIQIDSIDSDTNTKISLSELKKQSLIKQSCKFNAEKVCERESNYNFHRPLSLLSRFRSVDNLSEITNRKNSSEKHIHTSLAKSLSHPSLNNLVDITIQSNARLENLNSKSIIVSDMSSSDIATELARESNVLDNDVHFQREKLIKRNTSALNKSDYDEKYPIERSSKAKGSIKFLEVTEDYSLKKNSNNNDKKREINIVLNDCETIKSAKFSGVQTVSNNGYNIFNSKDCEYVLDNAEHWRKYNHNRNKISGLEKHQEKITFDVSKGKNEEPNDLSEKENSDELSKLSLEFLKKNHKSFGSSSSIDRGPTTEVLNKQLVQPELSVLNPIPFNCSNNTLAQNAVQTKSQLFPKNISNSTPTCLPCHLEFFPENETVNGAKSNNNSSMDSNLQQHNSSNFLSQNSIKTLTHQDSFSILEPSNFHSNEIIHESHQKTFCDSGASKQTCINYSYGKINEAGAKVVDHRYHHLFEEKELYELIESNINDLHVLNTFHHESHWCIIAEKVRVWSI